MFADVTVFPPSEYLLHKVSMAYAIICSLNVETSQIQSFIILLCSLYHLPQVDQVGPGAFIFGKTSLVIKLTLVYLLCIQVIINNGFQYSDKSRLNCKASVFFMTGNYF